MQYYMQMENLTGFITKAKLSKAQQIILPKDSKAVLWSNRWMLGQWLILLI